MACSRESLGDPFYPTELRKEELFNWYFYDEALTKFLNSKDKVIKSRRQETERGSFRCWRRGRGTGCRRQMLSRRDCPETKDYPSDLLRGKE